MRPLCQMGTGRLEIVAGPMFSGKTEALIHRVRVAESFDMRVAVFKPTTDTRYGRSDLISHGGHTIKAQWIAPDAPNLPGAALIAIDEAQFLSSDAIPRILDIVDSGARVVLAGLDLDSRGRPFGPMPALMCFANEVVKLTGTCAKCRGASTRSHRLVRSDATVFVGGPEAYEPRCSVCFDPKGGA